MPGRFRLTLRGAAVPWGVIVLAACASTDDRPPTAAGSTTSVGATTAEVGPGTTVSTAASLATPASRIVSAREPVFAFTTASSIDGWRTQNDPVMGGLSTASLSWDDSSLVFAGNLSLDNGGGFASVVSPTLAEPTTWAAPDGMSIDVAGDGKTYLVQVRTANSGGWVRRFPTTAGAASTVVLRWSEFEPVDRFLNPIEQSGGLEPEDIESIAIYLLDKQEGPFRLALRSVR